MANPSGLSTYTGVPIHKYSTTPQKIGTINGHTLYEVVVVTTITSNGQVIFNVSGKQIISINGNVSVFSKTQVICYTLVPYYDYENHVISFWDDKTNLYLNLGSDIEPYVKNQKLQLIIQYYV